MIKNYTLESATVCASCSLYNA